MKHISIHKLTKCFGDKPVLNVDSFDIDRGQFIGLLGPNGSGKSTLLQLLATLRWCKSIYCYWCL